MEEEIAKGINRFQESMGFRPEVCYIHPYNVEKFINEINKYSLLSYTLPFNPFIEEKIIFMGVEIKGHPFMALDSFILGMAIDFVFPTASSHIS